MLTAEASYSTLRHTVKPVVEMCSEIPPCYDYFNVRYHLEAMIWKLT